MKWFALIIIYYTVSSMVSGQQKSVVVDTGWYLGDDIYVWGYVDNQKPSVSPALPETPKAPAIIDEITIKVSKDIKNKINEATLQDTQKQETVSPMVSGQQKSVVDTGWYLGKDRYVWGYVDNQKPSVSSTLPVPTPKAATNTDEIPVKFSKNNENKINEAAVQQKQKQKHYESGKIEYSVVLHRNLKELMKSNDTIAALVNKLCVAYNPPSPEFKAPGRRISESKCQEYIWNIKLEAERKNKFDECKSLIASFGRNYYDIPTTIGGRNTEPGEFPHMGAIGWKRSDGEWKFNCGSSLISSKFILTAAHCSEASKTDLQLADPIPKIVRLHYKNIVRDLPSRTQGLYDIKISKIIVHPEYFPPRKYNDIALMELESAVWFSQLVQPSCLWGDSNITQLGSSVTLTGWGVLAEGSLDISPELQAAVLDIIDSEKCEQYLRSWCNRNWCGVRDHQLCAGKLSGGVDACQGDSGGPIQVPIPLNVNSPLKIYYIVGVTSFGVGCAQPNLPGVYTKVSSFIDWIEGIVWRD